MSSLEKKNSPQFFCPFFLTLFDSEVQMINNAVLLPRVQQSDSVIHIHVPILFQILFPVKLLQNTE